MTQTQLFDMPAPHCDDNCEWYTPAHIIEAARACMGGIDLDPASCEEANRVVRASAFYTREQDGLQQEWKGRVWLNPPYSRGVIEAFAQKLIHSPQIEAAILLTNNASDTAWWQQCAKRARAICFLRGRLTFWGPQERGNSPTQGQTVMLFRGYSDVDIPHMTRFEHEFSQLGVIL